MNIRPSSSLISSTALGIAAALITPCFALSAFAATQTSTRHLHLVSANAQLTRRLDTQTASMGETVTARLTGSVKAADAMTLPRGTMLIGKVERVHRSTDHGPSQLSVLFNEARLKDGHTVPVKATILAAYPGANGGEDIIGTQTGFVPYNQKVIQDPGTLSHVTMHSAVQGKVSAVFTSKDRNIVLGQGTGLQIAIAPMTKAEAAS